MNICHLERPTSLLFDQVCVCIYPEFVADLYEWPETAHRAPAPTFSVGAGLIACCYESRSATAGIERKP